MSNPVNKRVLMVCPSFPVIESGAEQMDRADGIRQLVRLGCEVVIIAKIVEWADRGAIERTAREMGVRVVPVPYRYSNRKLSPSERVWKFLGKFRNPLYFDGAAYEYAEPGIRAALARELKEFRPNVVWFEYTYLWPLYRLVRRAGVSIITRSNNFEPVHFLEEGGYTLFNYLKFVPKFLGEIITASLSDALLAITPKEERLYRKLGARRTGVLPLRSLPRFLASPLQNIREHRPLNVFFMGSSYSVTHNEAAAEFFLRQIIPKANRRAPGEFAFHILGAKLPDGLVRAAQQEGCHYEGYVQNIQEFLSSMDVALVPSLMGAGMQQKVFEPIVRGIPTITSRRAIAGYAYASGREFIAGKKTD